MRAFRLCAASSLAVALAACSSLSQTQDTVARFNQGVHSASTAQTGFFQAVRTSDCNDQFYKSAFEFAAAQKDGTGRYPAVTFDATGATCTPAVLTDDQMAIRQKLMNALVFYADALQTLANGSEDKDLSANSKAAVTSLKGLAQQEKLTLSASTNTVVAAVNAAVVGITQMIFDRSKYKDIQSAAAAVQNELHTVVGALKTENLANAQGLVSQAAGLGNDYQTALLSAREQRGVASFIDAVQVRLTYQQVQVTASNVKQLNDTLDAVAAANDALAQGGQGGAIAEVSDLVSRAQQANALFNSVK